jgi:hypothetical protein
MGRRYFVFLFCFISVMTVGQTKKLGPDAEIYLLTISPGEELYSSFGHSTLLIEDYKNQISEMYNYGSFDFDTENFYIKFLRGTLPYQLTKNDMTQALSYWTSQNRLVTKQRLRMGLENKQKIYDLIEENYKPENRTYQYKFFYDNCSTRIRDLIVNVMGDSIKIDKTFNGDQSYRDWIETYAGNKAIADFGMDIAIGIPADELTGYNGAMYIPDNLMYAFDSAAVQVNGRTKSFVIDKYLINSMYVKPVLPKKELNIPLILSIVLFLISIYFAVNKRSQKVDKVGLGNKILFIFAGVAGIILTLLWFLTDHGVTAYNLNILWANPFFLYIFYRTNKTNSKLFLYAAIAAAVVVVIDLTQIQDIPLAADIIAISLAVRLFTLYNLTNGRA